MSLYIARIIRFLTHISKRRFTFCTDSGTFLTMLYTAVAKENDELGPLLSIYNPKETTLYRYIMQKQDPLTEDT